MEEGTMTTESNATATTRAEERRRRELYEGMDAADLAREALNLAREALDVNEDRRDWLGYVAAMESVLAERTRADDDQGDDQEPEPSAPRRASNGTPDDDDREQDDDDAPAAPAPRRRTPLRGYETERALRPLCEQSLTVCIPWDRARRFTLQYAVVARWLLNDEDGECLDPYSAEARERFREEAGWVSFGSNDHECFVRVFME
jgi:hypothetical protein